MCTPLLTSIRVYFTKYYLLCMGGCTSRNVIYRDANSYKNMIIICCISTHAVSYIPL